MPNIPRFIAWIPRRVRPDLPTCSICKEPVELETTKTDEYGKAVHEECHVLKSPFEAGHNPARRLTTHG